MTATALVAELTLRGVRLETDGQDLSCYPAYAVGPQWRAALTAHKAEIIATLLLVDAEDLVGAQGALPFGDDGWPVDTVLIVECNACGAIARWWDVFGQSHCAHCHPPHPRADVFRNLAATLQAMPRGRQRRPVTKDNDTVTRDAAAID